MMSSADSFPITCYIRAKNEERMIVDVIQAAFLVASEVIVIDSGSTDKTIELSRNAGARVIESPWLGGGKQKRIGEDAAHFPWMLDLDADEIVTNELAEEIKQLFANGNPPFSVYELTLVTSPPVGDLWVKSNLVKRNRLYDKRVIRARNHSGWDQLDIPSGLPVGKLNAHVIHYPYRDLEHLTFKFNRSSSSRVQNSSLKSYWWVILRLFFGPFFYFVQHYVLRGMWRRGLYGFAVACISAHGRWLKDAKMLEIHHKKKKPRER